METFLIKALQLMLSLSLLVVIHEFGHFFFAKWSKVRVDKFYMFFNPQFVLFRLKKVDGKVRFRFFAPNTPEAVVALTDENGEKLTDEKGHTLYRAMTDDERSQLPEGDWRRDPANTEFGIGWVPFGGYCRIVGMVDETQSAKDLAVEPQPWEFRSKKSFPRLMIMVGGVLMNFLLALFIYSMVLLAWGDSYVSLQDMTAGMKFNEHAQQIGFRDGDILLSADDTPLERADVDMIRSISNAHIVKVLRQGSETEVFIPELNLIDVAKEQPAFVDVLIPNVIDSIIPAMPFAQAGIMKGDRITSIDDHPIHSHNEFLQYIAQLKQQAEDAGKHTATFPLVYERAGNSDTLVIETDSLFHVGFTAQMPAYKNTNLSYNFLSAFPAGVTLGINTLNGYVSDLKYVFTKQGAENLGGFGTIGSIFPAQWNWYRFWMMTAFLSIILAFMNILPIPVLDGGYVLFLLIEMATGWKPNEKVMERCLTVGFVLLIILMAWANLNDVIRFLF